MYFWNLSCCNIMNQKLFYFLLSWKFFFLPLCYFHNYNNLISFIHLLLLIAFIFFHQSSNCFNYVFKFCILKKFFKATNKALLQMSTLIQSWNQAMKNQATNGVLILALIIKNQAITNVYSNAPLKINLESICHLT